VAVEALIVIVMVAARLLDSVVGLRGEAAVLVVAWAVAEVVSGPVALT
jgi:hypothetical protein